MDQKYFHRTAENFDLATDRLRSQSRFSVAPDRIRQLDAKVDHWRRRVQMREMQWRFPAVLAELASGRYGPYSLGWKSVLQDLFL